MDTLGVTFQNMTVLDAQSNLSVPNVIEKFFAEPAKVLEVIFEPGQRRSSFMKDALQQLYPNDEYWDCETIEQIEARCLEVSKMFGLTYDLSVIQGTSSHEEQEDFWANVFQGLADCEDVKYPEIENVEVPEADHVGSLIKRSNEILEILGLRSPSHDDTIAAETNMRPNKIISDLIVASTGKNLLEIQRITSHTSQSPESSSNVKLCELVEETIKAMDTFKELYGIYTTSESDTPVSSSSCSSKEQVEKLKQVNANLSKIINAIKGVQHVFELTSATQEDSIIR